MAAGAQRMMVKMRVKPTIFSSINKTMNTKKLRQQNIYKKITAIE